LEFPVAGFQFPAGTWTSDLASGLVVAVRYGSRFLIFLETETGNWQLSLNFPPAFMVSGANGNKSRAIQAELGPARDAIQ
jgi:hypothetical protein